MRGRAPNTEIDDEIRDVAEDLFYVSTLLHQKKRSDLAQRAAALAMAVIELGRAAREKKG